MSSYQFDEHRFFQTVSGTRIDAISSALVTAVNTQASALKHGHLETWEKAVSSLPATEVCGFTCDENGSIVTNVSADTDRLQLTKSLQALMPWRKGPYQIGPVFIDTEWRSDWKWSRLSSHITCLTGKSVLDVGCGNGYHMWRIRLAGANLVLGIDPSLLYVKQFDAVQHFIQDDNVLLLPLPMEAIPPSCSLFDAVFSMGVLYHRRNPHQHLRELQGATLHGGELILETLIAPGKADDSLIIEARYANMRNIYELPTLKRLCQWIESAGFTDLKIADVSTTSRNEQRSTAWMQSFSLAQALDPDDSSKTIEGHPRPLRAVIVATKGWRAPVWPLQLLRSVDHRTGN